jgi:hypothetical protein
MKKADRKNINWITDWLRIATRAIGMTKTPWMILLSSAAV